MFCFAQQYSRKVNYVIVNNKGKKKTQTFVSELKHAVHTTQLSMALPVIFLYNPTHAAMPQFHTFSYKKDNMNRVETCLHNKYRNLTTIPINLIPL